MEFDNQFFLQHFQKNDHRTLSTSASLQKVDHLLFMISFDERGLAYVKVVDAKGKEVQTDYRLYTDTLFSTLRAIEKAREEIREKIVWSNGDELIYLYEYRWVLYELIRCPNLVDSQLHPLQVCDTPLQLRVVITPTGKGEYTSRADVAGEGLITDDFQLLADNFVLADGKIYPLKPIGDNFSALRYFCTRFPESWIEPYLSVLFSYLTNVLPVLDDYKLVPSEQVVETIPTLIFEKVDEDMALYIRLVEGLEGYDHNFLQRFDLIYLARLTMEHQILLHRIAHRDHAADLKSLKHKIVGYAKTSDRKSVYQEDDLFIVPEAVAGPFLLGALPSLVRDYRIVGSESLKNYKVRPAQPKLGLRVGSGIDFLEGTATVSIDEEQFTLRDFLAQYRKDKYITLSDGNRAIIDESYMRRLERLYRHGSQKDGTLRVNFFDLPEVEELMQQRMEGAAFEHHRAIYDGFNHLREQRMRFPQVRATLRTYQEEGVKWINYLYENRLGGCLADDMGLGKTLQTIAMLARIYPKVKNPSLLVMPRTLLFNWQDELEKFAPQLSFSIYYGSQRDLKTALKSQLVLTTYALVRNDIKDLCKKKFHYVILDESQNIKNVSSQTTQAIMLLQGEHRLALSGTPIENNLTELYSLFRFLNPGMFGSLEEFNREYTTPIQQQGDKATMIALRRKIFPFVLRRVKRDVLTELPDRIEQTLYCEMSDAQMRFYEERRRYYHGMVKSEIKANGIAKSQMVMFQALSELRRIASVPESLSDGQVHSPKIDQLMDSISEATDNGHKVVVFFNFIAGIELVSERLEQLGIDFATMTGSTHDRRSVVSRFQNEVQCQVLLMTMKTGGVGLNLTTADTVFIFEPWWNRAAEEQAINRLHRIGQTQKVMSYSIIMRDTIEEKIRLLQEKKSQLFDGLIGNDTTSSKVLTEEDIDFILS